MNSLHPAPAGTNRPFLLALGPASAQVAQPEKAVGMARHMKSAMPFRGVPSPEVRATVRELAKRHPFADVAQLAATVMELWDAATFREERYAAIMATGLALGRGDAGLLPFYAHVIATGQWWDYVDAVAPRVWELLARDRAAMDPLLRQWSVHPNLWFRRTAIIAQLPAKSATDTQLLHDVVTVEFRFIFRYQLAVTCDDPCSLTSAFLDFVSLSYSPFALMKIAELRTECDDQTHGTHRYRRTMPPAMGDGRKMVSCGRESCLT